MLTNTLYLAFKSLQWYRGRVAIIVLCLGLTLWVPVTTRILIRQFEQEIQLRASSTPLLIGAPGSRVDLVLHGLYFQSTPPAILSMAEADYIHHSQLATAIPLHIRFRTQQVGPANAAPIVGTTLEYFEFRQLELAAGEGLTRLGDCLLGAGFAAASGLQPGDRLLSAPKNAFNLAGDYPLNMRVSGILAPSGSPDDAAVFVDIKTTWIIEGIGHGHQQLTAESPDQLLSGSDTDTLTANASVLPYTEITDANEASFHFHGDESEFPVTEILAVPRDRQAQTLLLGRYASVRRQAAVCVKPKQTVQQLLSMVFRVEELFRGVALLSGLVTAALLGLVLFLSIRLRAPEMRTMQRIGCARGTVAWLLATEIGLMVLSGLGLALAAAWGTRLLAGDWLRHLLF